jgi:hypothetical protein
MTVPATHGHDAQLISIVRGGTAYETGLARIVHSVSWRGL